MATTNLGLKTFGHDEPIDFNDWNDNLVKIDTAVGEAKRGKAAHSLLDNGDFQINQRGASSYTGAGYTVDRWYMYKNNSELTATPSSNGLTLENSGSSVYNIIQRLPFDLSGKTVTFAVCDSTGSVTILSGVIPTGDVSSNTSMLGSANSADGSYYITIYKRSSTQGHEARINVFAGRSTTIRWAALYEGAYTADTLPDYVPKGYAAELAECQMYFERLGVADSVILGTVAFAKSGAKSVIISMQYQPKRVSRPTLSFSDVSKYRLLLMDAVNASVFSATQISSFDEIAVQSPFASVRVTMPNPLDRDCWVRLQREDNSDGAYIDVDADL